jgi:hypothetical protein
MLSSVSSPHWIIFSLCLFVGFLSFKPSEPYLSEYLVCNKNTQEDFCNSYATQSECNTNKPCAWVVSNDIASCGITSCSDVSLDDCGDSDFNYCSKKDQTCSTTSCYEHFSEDQVNDDIYPWSTYAYLPFLLLLGPYAELFSYRVAILLGICGRLVTRFLLIYGRSLFEMQLMQVRDWLSVHFFFKPE